VKERGIRLLVMGTVEAGGSGCVCPESVLLKSLVTHLLLSKNEVLIMDMEAGIEHLGRATSSSVDALVIVVNPGARSRAAAEKIRKLGRDIGIKKIIVLGNRVSGPEDEELIRQSLPGFEILGFLPEDQEIVTADREGRRPHEDLNTAPSELFHHRRPAPCLEKIKDGSLSPVLVLHPFL